MTNTPNAEKMLRIAQMVVDAAQANGIDLGYITLSDTGNASVQQVPSLTRQQARMLADFFVGRGYALNEDEYASSKGVKRGWFTVAKDGVDIDFMFKIEARR